MIVWHWLVSHGLYEDLVSTVVFISLGQLLVWRHIKRAWRWLLQLTDLLDTSTPGGLSDVTERLERTERQLVQVNDQLNEFRRQRGERP